MINLQLQSDDLIVIKPMMPLPFYGSNDSEQGDEDLHRIIEAKRMSAGQLIELVLHKAEPLGWTEVRLHDGTDRQRAGINERIMWPLCTRRGGESGNKVSQGIAKQEGDLARTKEGVTDRNMPIG